MEIPKLNKGEIYVGALGDAHGNLHHVILLPSYSLHQNWQAQKEWAASIGGDLPTRIEQAMLMVNFCDQFEKDWYWSNEERNAVSDYAWCQSFSDGTHGNTHKSNERRARAVRRVKI